jgi:hypothetical protein
MHHGGTLGGSELVGDEVVEIARAGVPLRLDAEPAKRLLIDGRVPLLSQSYLGTPMISEAY